MDQSKTALERAFELARSGQFDTVGAIVSAVVKEGYARAQLDGPMLRRQLLGLIKDAKPQIGAD